MPIISHRGAKYVFYDYGHMSRHNRVWYRLLYKAKKVQASLCKNNAVHRMWM